MLLPQLLLDGSAQAVQPEDVDEQSAPDDGESDEHGGQRIHRDSSWMPGNPRRIVLRRSSSRWAAMASWAPICARRMLKSATYSSVNAATFTSRAYSISGGSPEPNPSELTTTGSGCIERHHTTERWMSGMSRKPTIPSTAAKRALWPPLPP